MVGTVLLIVCVNVGNLMLVWTASRDREAGIRLALGAGRGELFGLVLKEALVLTAIGSGLGLLLAHAALKAFVAAAPVDLPRIGDVQMDGRALAFAVAAAAISTLICGLLPAWRLARIEPQESLRAGPANLTESGGKLQIRELLVSAEVALSTLLLVIGGLLMLSFVRVMRVPKGFQVRHVIAQGVSLIGPKYSDNTRTRFIDEALRKLGSIPGVESAGVTNQVPLRGETWIDGLREPDQPENREPALANFRFVSSDFWKVMGIPLKEGRFFQEVDRGRNVAILSERAAQLLWPAEDPIGKRVHLTGGNQEVAGEVIGVVGDARADLEKNAPLTVYEPYWTINVGGPSFVVRTQGEPAALIGAVRAALRSLDSSMPLLQAETMEQILDGSVAGRRFEMDLAVAFAAAALLLSSLGVYGIVSFAVARRTPEIGIRVALGARPPELVAMMLWQGMLPVMTGLALGLASAVLSGRLLGSELFGISPHDPMTISAVTILLMTLAFLACLIPARRAACIDPVRALRFE
jgi:predicted permease